MKSALTGYALPLALAGAVLAMPLLLAATSSKTRLTRLSCGETIRTSIVLANDLNCGSGNGLNVGASGITINLNRHKLTGAEGDSVGVNVGGHSGVTVENGTITDFTWGVLVEVANDSRIHGLRLTRNNGYGAFVVASNGAILSGNYIFSNGDDGILVGGRQR